MKRTISSSQTILMKIIFPMIWIPLFGMGALTVLFSPSNDLTFPKLYFLFLWIVGSAFIYWLCIRLKKVSVDGGFLYVSNYVKEITVPLTEIYDVTENVWINIHPVTIHLKFPSEFGDKIRFMPKTRFFAWFSSHPIVSELQELATLKN